MTIAERFYKVTKELPAPLLAELLDFAEFLRQRKSPGRQSMGHTMILTSSPSPAADLCQSLDKKCEKLAKADIADWASTFIVMPEFFYRASII